LHLGFSFSRDTGSPTAPVGIFGSGYGLMVLIIKSFGILSMFSMPLSVVRGCHGHYEQAHKAITDNPTIVMSL
jgi:hypothetical protein